MEQPKAYTFAGGRQIALASTHRATYRLQTLPRVPSIDDVRAGGRPVAFLCQHIWAALADKKDQRLLPEPEDIAAILPEDPEAVTALWEFIWREMYGAAGAQEGADTDPKQAKATGGTA